MAVPIGVQIYPAGQDILVVGTHEYPAGQIAPFGSVVIADPVFKEITSVKMTNTIKAKILFCIIFI